MLAFERQLLQLGFPHASCLNALEDAHGASPVDLLTIDTIQI